MIYRRLVSFLVLVVCGVFAATVSSAQQHFTACVSGTGSSATIVLPASADITAGGQDLAAGDEVAAVTSTGECAGVAVWTGENVVLTAWGDDALAEGTDGFVDGEAIRFRVWSSEFGELLASDVAFRADKAHLRADDLFVSDGIYVVDELRASPGDDVNPDVTLSNDGERATAFRLEQNYPNPFHDSTVISYQLQEPGHIELEVYNVRGQRVRQLVSQNQSVGHHTTTLRAGDLPGGLYLIRLKSGTQTQVRNVLLAR